jgi:hypothetical protein
MRMTNRYETLPSVAKEVKVSPSNVVLRNILNYSKSIEYKQKGNRTILVHLN